MQIMNVNIVVEQNMNDTTSKNDPLVRESSLNIFTFWIRGLLAMVIILVIGIYSYHLGGNNINCAHLSSETYSRDSLDLYTDINTGDRDGDDVKEKLDLNIDNNIEINNVSELGE